MSDATWWINGELVEPSAAALPATDHGITVGDGCFETTRVVRGEAFALTRHLRRLRRSLEALRIDLPMPDDELREAVRQVLAADPEARVVRITVTAGHGPLSSGRADSAPSVLVAGAPDRGWEPTTAVVTVPWVRNDRGVLTGVKSTSYAENVIAFDEARRRGATEALMANTRGHLCEGTGTNVFCEFDGRLVTPPLSSGCLAGVTRELVLEITEAEELDVEFGHLGRTAEAFLTSSTRDVMPIVRIDDRGLDVGPLTEAARTAFAALQASTTDP